MRPPIDVLIAGFPCVLSWRRSIWCPLSLIIVILFVTWTDTCSVHFFIFTRATYHHMLTMLVMLTRLLWCIWSCNNVFTCWSLVGMPSMICRHTTLTAVTSSVYHPLNLWVSRSLCSCRAGSVILLMILILILIASSWYGFKRVIIQYVILRWHIPRSYIQNETSISHVIFWVAHSSIFLLGSFRHPLAYVSKSKQNSPLP